MTENKRFSVKKSGSGLFYRDGDYEIDNTIQFIIETIEMKLNQLYDENEQLKSDNNRLVKQTAETIEKHQQRVLDLIDEKIIECEKAVEDIRYNGKDSYIVKHDVASKLLKELIRS